MHKSTMWVVVSLGSMCTYFMLLLVSLGGTDFSVMMVAAIALAPFAAVAGVFYSSKDPGTTWRAARSVCVLVCSILFVLFFVGSGYPPFNFLLY